MKKLLPIFATLFLFSCANNKAVISKIDFDVKTKITKTKLIDGEEKNLSTTDLQTSLSLFIGRDFIEYQNSNNKTLINFSQKRKFIFDKDGKQIADNSLYAEAAYRIMESANRFGLNQMMKAAKIKTYKADDIVLIEHLFSITSKNKSPIKINKTDYEIVYLSDRDDYLVTTSTKLKAKLKKHEIKQLVKFLRYDYGIHPVILADFEKRSVLPEKIKIKFYEINQVREIEITVLNHHNEIEDLSRLSQTAISNAGSENNKFANLFLRAQLLSQNDIENYQETILKKAVKAAENKKFLEAMLNFFSYANLVSENAGLPPEFFRFKSDIARDSDVKELVAAINPTSFSKDPQKMLNILNRAEKKAGGGAALLLIYKANNLISSSKSLPKNIIEKEEKPQELFYRALSQNPFLANAWIDLGKIFHSNYNSFDAWQCYDIAKKLSPNHKMLEQIYKTEQQIELYHPEFFNLN